MAIMFAAVDCERHERIVGPLSVNVQRATVHIGSSALLLPECTHTANTILIE
jgi:hypothetical protein